MTQRVSRWWDDFMVITTLIFCLFLLLTTNLIAQWSKHPVRWIALICAGGLLGPDFLGFHLWVVMLLDGLMLVALIGWRISRTGPTWFLRLSGVALGVTTAVVMVEFRNAGQEYDRLRTNYPFESMADRLPTSNLAALLVSLSPGGEAWLTKREEFGNYPGIRSRRLRLLHERSVQLFSRRVGFGVSRMSRGADPIIPTERNLAWRGYETKRIAQPGALVATTSSPGDWAIPIASERDFLRPLHEESVADFTGSWGFGYFQDRRHVAGFLSHRFQKVHQPFSRWQVRTLELVGLVVASEPRVYVSDQLPNMQELKHNPTRPLDSLRDRRPDQPPERRRGHDHLRRPHAPDARRHPRG